MRILQIVLPGAPEYEKKSQRIDRVALEGRGHTVVVAETVPRDVVADVAQVYGPLPDVRRQTRKIVPPYLASVALPQARLPRFFDRSKAPAVVVGPVAGEGVRLLPEAVEESYFDAVRSAEEERPRKKIGSFAGARPGIRDMAERTMTRIHRFRDDVEWHLFDVAPSPADLIGVDAWIDPASDESDADGFVAEALVTGTPVIAARTRLNEARSDKGRTAILVPPGDSNELTHAILTALFKPEVAQQKVQAGRLTASKFRPGQRLRILLTIYETLCP